MKYLKDGNFPQNRLLKIVLFTGLAYLASSHLSGVIIHAYRTGFTYSATVEKYLGAEEKFMNPVSLQGLLEITHMHMFSIGIGILLAGHLAAFTPLPGRLKAVLALAPVVSGFLEVLSGWLIVYCSALFAYLKIASVLVFEISFAALLAAAFFAVAACDRKPPGPGGAHKAG